MKRILVPLLILVLVCFCLPGLAEGNAIRFDRSVNQVFEGETLQTVLTREGACAEGDVSWQSSNPRVATVDEQGVVTGVVKGQATITAAVQAAGKTFRAQLTVTVSRKAAEVQVATAKLPIFDPADPLLSGLLETQEGAEENALPVLVLPVRKSYNLQATVLPKDASNRRVVFSVSDESVAHIRGTSVSGQAPGEAILTIASEASPEISVRYRLLVIQPVTRISPSASAPAVTVGSQVTLAADILPESASIPKVVWSSADERIATVDENGVVTGVRRGTARLIATTVDGSSVRANISIRVEQNATDLTLNQQELTVDAGRTAVLRATVLPADTNNKNVTWSSSDESVATVNKAGRISAIALGTCEITCTSQSSPQVRCVATVHVQQPVTRITFGAPIVVYMGETAKVSWTVEPDNASNPVISLSSSNNRILTVEQDGTVTPVRLGQAYVNAISTDGSNRRARVLVKVLQHVESVAMKRSVAYIDVKEGAMTGAEIYPSNASNKNMFWETANPEIVSVTGQRDRVRLVGVSQGDTVVTGTTEDGGYQASIKVRVGDWDHALHLNKFDWNKSGQFYLDVTNRSELRITSITAKITFYEVEDDGELEPLPVNTKDGSNEITAVWSTPLTRGDNTGREYWRMYNYSAPSRMRDTAGEIRIVSFQIDYDWIKTIRTWNQPHKKW